MKPFGLSVKIVIEDHNGRCLVLRRSMSSKGNPGKWDFPGGKIDVGETFDHALLREVAEETGLTIAIQGVAGTAEGETPTHKVIYLILRGSLVAGTVGLSDEHDDFRWVPLNELPKMDLVPSFLPFAKAFYQKNSARQS